MLDLFEESHRLRELCQEARQQARRAVSEACEEVSRSTDLRRKMLLSLWRGKILTRPVAKGGD